MKNPPSRLSVDPESEYCQPLWLRMPLIITVDGVRVRRCLEYDVEGGWARCSKVDDEGRPVVTDDGEHWAEEVLRGEVRVTVEHQAFLS